MKWIDQISMTALLVIALTLGLAPFVPQPHIVEKLTMLMNGSLSRPIDIFDLFMHGTPWVLLGIKLVRVGRTKSGKG
ncbi:MAG TPA: RND transporter [Gammaproteobacteria bacterium]|nr:RND transporter [Gammaproteobacteria bacterium]